MMTRRTSSPKCLHLSSRLGRRFALAILLGAGLLPGCGGGGGGGGGGDHAPRSPSLLWIEVAPDAPSLAAGTRTRLTATGVFTGDLRRDLTADVGWTTSNEATATVSNAPGQEGEAAGLAPGTATVTASLGEVHGSTTITVTDAVLVALQVTPLDRQVPLGTTVQFQALGTFSSGPTQDLTAAVTWSSSNPSTATIDDSGRKTGQVESLAVGTTTIEATHEGFEASARLTVSDAALVAIAVEGSRSPIALGTSARLSAVGIYSDGSRQDVTRLVSWSSSDPAIAAVSAGTATGARRGTATVSAFSGGVTGSAALTVTDAALTAIEVTPTRPSIALGTNLTLAATGLYSDGSFQDLTNQVIWASSPPDVAVVANTAGMSGLVTSEGVGSATVTASLQTVKGSTQVRVTPAALVSINVTPFAPSGPAGTGLALRAIGNFSDGSTQDLTSQATWETSSSQLAAVEGGQVRLIATGNVTVSARRGGIVGFSPLSVTAATLRRIEVTPAEARVPAGQSRRFSALGVFSDETTVDLTGDVAWMSGDDAVATVSNAPGSAGTALGVRTGATTVSASSRGFTGAAALSVSAASLTALEISPPDPALTVGQGLQLAAIGRYSDGSEEDLTSRVTWASDSAATASVSNAPDRHGWVTGVGAGSAQISASVEGVTNQTTATVIFDPRAPVSAVLTMSPNVILNTGGDAATLSVTVQAADPQRVVPDGTPVSFEVTRGAAVLGAAVATTVSGGATTTLTSMAAGPVVVTATIQGGDVRTWTSGLVTDNFLAALAAVAGSRATMTGTSIDAGSRFLLAVLNRSNRPFAAEAFEFRNGGELVFRTTDFPSLPDGQLRSGTWLVGVATNTAPVPDAGLVAGYRFRDVRLGTEFGFGVAYRLSAPPQVSGAREVELGSLHP